LDDVYTTNKTTGVMSLKDVGVVVVEAAIRIAKLLLKGIRRLMNGMYTLSNSQRLPYLWVEVFGQLLLQPHSLLMIHSFFSLFKLLY
jgi:hypothetical protein